MKYGSVAAVATLGVFLIYQTALADDAIGYTIAPHERIRDDERVVALKITLEQGAFTSFIGIPDGWIFDLFNGAHGKTDLAGDISVGAAALYRKELTHVGICVRPKPYRNWKFALSGTLIVTSDFEKKRTIHLTERDFSQVACRP